MKRTEFTVLIIVLAVLVLLLLLVANPFKQPGTSPTKGEPLFPSLRTGDPARIVVDGPNDLVLWKGADDEWLVRGETEEQVFPADTAGVFRALRAALAATDREVMSSNPEKQSIFEVDSTGVFVKITAADSTVLADFVIGKSGSNYATNYVRPLGSDDVYLVGERIKNQFNRQWKTMRDLFILKVAKDELARIELTRADSTIALVAKDDGAWEMLSPREGIVKKDIASRLTSTLNNFRADEIYGDDPEGKGFDAPFAQVTVVMKDGTDRIIAVGDAAVMEGRRYARMEGKKWVYEIGTYRIETLTKSVDEMLEPPPAVPDSTATTEPGTDTPPIPKILPGELAPG